MNNEKEKSVSLFSINAITLSTFLGGWIAGFLMIAYNFKQLGQKRKASNAYIVCIITTILFFVAIILIPLELFEMIPGFILPLSYVLTIKLYADKSQKKQIDQHFEEDGEKSFNW